MLVMVCMCVALVRDLRHDPLIVRGRRGEEAVESAVITGHELYDGNFELGIVPGDGTDVEVTGEQPVVPKTRQE